MSVHTLPDGSLRFRTPDNEVLFHLPTRTVLVEPRGSDPAEAETAHGGSFHEILSTRVEPTGQRRSAVSVEMVGPSWVRLGVFDDPEHALSWAWAVASLTECEVRYVDPSGAPDAFVPAGADPFESPTVVIDLGRLSEPAPSWDDRSGELTDFYRRSVAPEAEPRRPQSRTSSTRRELGRRDSSGEGRSRRASSGFRGPTARQRES